jgi:Protein of unknown function (DUF2441)
MVEAVKNYKLYHVTLTNPYKQAFVAKQRVSIGTQHNPFFAFYERAREYSVTDRDTGGIFQVKAVDWITRVRDKRILTSPEILASIAHEVTQHYIMLCRELIMEEIRRDEFNGEPPSRQVCLYGCDTIEEARFWSQLLGADGSVCELKCTGVIHRADSRLLLKDSEPLSITRDRARSYWRGEASDDPRFETLFVGDITVVRRWSIESFPQSPKCIPRGRTSHTPKKRPRKRDEAKQSGRIQSARLLCRKGS